MTERPSPDRFKEHFKVIEGDVPDKKPSETKPITATPFAWIDPKEIPPRDWLYGRHYMRKIMNVTVAHGGVGKSTLVLSEALAMVSGKPLLGHEVQSPLRVWLFNGEDPREEMDRRTMAAAVGHGLTADDISDRLFLDVGRENQWCIAQTLPGSGTTILNPVKQAIIEEIQNRHIDVLIVDPFVSTHRVSENDNNAIEIAAQAWREIADATNCAVMLVHHAKKTGGEEINAEHSRGGIALVAAARDVRVLNQMTEKEAENGGIEPSKHRSYFRTFSDKANMAPPAESSKWYELRGVCLDNETDTREADWVGVVYPYEYSAVGEFGKFSAEQIAAAQDAIAMASPEDRRASPQSVGWVGRLIAGPLSLDADDTEDKKSLKSIVSTWKKSGVLEEEKIADENRKMRPTLTLKNRSGDII